MSCPQHMPTPGLDPLDHSRARPTPESLPLWEGRFLSPLPMGLSQNQLMFFWDGRYPNVSYLAADTKDPHPDPLPAGEGVLRRPDGGRGLGCGSSSAARWHIFPPRQCRLYSGIGQPKAGRNWGYAEQSGGRRDSRIEATARVSDKTAISSSRQPETGRGFSSMRQASSAIPLTPESLSNRALFRCAICR